MKHTDLLGNKKLFLIISHFLEHPSLETSQTAIIKTLKLSKATAVKWLKPLAERGYLNLKAVGATNLYSLNRNNPSIKQLKILCTILKFEELTIPGSDIFLYGSAARGEDTERSDIDLLIIGAKKPGDIIGKIEKLSEKIGKPINFKIFSELDWSRLIKSDPAFYERVEKDKIQLTWNSTPASQEDT